MDHPTSGGRRVGSSTLNTPGTGSLGDNTRRCSIYPTARSTFALLGLLLFASLAGRGRFGVPLARAQVAQDTFVGKLQGVNASIAIVSDGSGVIAYICDGAGNAISADFSGT